MQWIELEQYIAEHFPGRYQFSAPMSQHTTFHVGGPADMLVMPATRDEVAGLIQKGREAQIPLTIMGNGSNLLVLDRGIRGLVIKLGNGLKQVQRMGCCLYAEAGITLATLAGKAAQWGLTGLEFASGIPGTLGGAVLMNAGAYGGEIGNLVEEVTTLSLEGKQKSYKHSDCAFRYRHSLFQDTGEIVLWVKLHLTPGTTKAIRETMTDLANRRQAKQPLNYPSAGSTFKRPAGNYAAALIDQAGLRGFRIGDAQVSEKHTGFVVNRGHATAADILQLMDAVRERVHAMSGIWLEPEVRILGEADTSEEKGGQSHE